jgi:hypothetical protein
MFGAPVEIISHKHYSNETNGSLINKFDGRSKEIKKLISEFKEKIDKANGEGCTFKV